MRFSTLNVRQSASSFAVGSAWFFIIVSLLHLLWVVGVKWDSPAGTAKLYHSVVDGVSYDGFGLAYAGLPGLLLALAQLAVVTAAASCTVRPLNRITRARRIGHLTLIAWSALWMFNLIWLASMDGQVDSIIQASLLTFLCGSTTYRAMRGWSPPPPRLAPPSDGEHDLSADHIASSDRVREIDRTSSRVQRTIAAFRRGFRRAGDLVSTSVQKVRAARVGEKARKLTARAKPGVAKAFALTRAAMRKTGDFLRTHGVIPPARSTSA